MKVAELKEKLSKLDKEDIIRLSIEFYKLIPKAKKEDYDLDTLINNPQKPKTSTKKNEEINLSELEILIPQFVENAKEQNYLVPNKIVSKKERATWRFKVKQWYKELSNTKRADTDIAKQSKLLSELYSLMCEACGYEYFSAYDPFKSVGIEQSDFYRTVIHLMQESKGKTESVELGIKLIVNNHLNRYTLYSSLMKELLATLDIPDLKEKGIEVVKRLIAENNFKPKPVEKRNIWMSSGNEFRKQRKHNNLVELGFRFYCGLFDVNQAIAFHQKHHYERDEEIKLYILVSLLLDNGRKEEIKVVIGESIAKGIKPRDRLMEVLKEIKEKNTVPNYL